MGGERIKTNERLDTKKTIFLEHIKGTEKT